MKLYIATVLIAFISVVKLQQYRLVPTCSDEPLDPNNPAALKGDKGDRGISGKAGPPGVGIKGTKGEIGNCTRFQESVEQRLDRIESALDELRLKLEPASCLEANENGAQFLRNGDKVYCDGKWTVFQRRLDGSVSFDRPWQDYKFGFGNMSGEFWWGLENLYKMTRSGACRLRVELWDFEDNFAYAEYSSFFIDSESTNYVLHVDGYTGTAGDSLQHSGETHDNQPFTTRDRDNDNHATVNCGDQTPNINGGWWYDMCYRAAPNNPWGRSVGRWTNIIWYTWKGATEALKATKMMLRCD